MATWQEDFLERCVKQADGAATGESAFGAGPALWIGSREVAHFDEERTLDVRLTRGEISRRRGALKSDHRVELRSSTSDWLELVVETEDDVEWAMNIVLAAVAANRPTAPKGTPPVGRDLERRRRFH